MEYHDYSYLNNSNKDCKKHTNTFPSNSFLLVFLLFQNEHVMVEELLETFVGVVNTQLIEGVVLEDLESSNIQHTNVVGSSLFGLESFVNTFNDPEEHTFEDGFAQGSDGVVDLLNRLA